MNRKPILQKALSQTEIKDLWNKQSKKKGGTKMRDEFFCNIEFWCKEKGFAIKREYIPFPDRKFAIDRAILHHHPFGTSIFNLKIAIEWEGLNSEKSVHTTITGYTSNCEKYNRLSIEGWIVLRYTVLNHKHVFADLNKIYDAY